MLRWIKDWITKSYEKEKKRQIEEKALMNLAMEKFRDFESLVTDSNNYEQCHEILQELRQINRDYSQCLQGSNITGLGYLKTSIDSGELILNTLIKLKAEQTLNERVEDINNWLAIFKKKVNGFYVMYVK